MKKEYEFLNKINFPSDLKKVSESKLQKVAVASPTTSTPSDN